MSDSDDSSYIIEEKKYAISTKHCGTVYAYVQGDLSQGDKKAIFLTVHDLGSNHTVFHQFIEHPCMLEMKARSVFIHVDIPGQEDNAPDLGDDFEFPTMQAVAEDLHQILDQLKVQLVVGIGEGAGANILARFGMIHPERILGLLLIHCTTRKSGLMDYFKEKFINWRLGSMGMNPTAEQYLVFHKFGGTLEEQLESADNKEKLIQEFTEKLKTNINSRNLKRYVEAYMNRTDMTSSLEKNFKVDCLLVAGARSSHINAVQATYAHMDKSKVSMMKIDDVADPLSQSPEKLAQSILLFCKGIGLLTSVTMPGVDRVRTFSGGEDQLAALGAGGRRRTMSMEEYDMPRRRSLTPQTTFIPKSFLDAHK